MLISVRMGHIFKQFLNVNYVLRSAATQLQLSRRIVLADAIRVVIPTASSVNGSHRQITPKFRVPHVHIHRFTGWPKN